MASKDPLNPVDMRNIYISEARCNSHFLRASEQYRLHFTILPPATVIGLRSPKSEYIKATHQAVKWKDPFGEEFTVTPAPIDCRVVIDLRKRRLGRSGQTVASCTLDLSAADKEIRLDLKNDADDGFGELIICVAPSLASTTEAIQNVHLATEQLGPGLAVVNDAIQAVSPLATEITAQFNAWQPLLNRLAALVKVADLLAEAHPWIRLTWGVVSAAYRIVSAQSDRDIKVKGLVQTMADSCSFADEAQELKKRSERDREIINQILRQLMECTYFIRDYCKEKSSVKRALKYAVSPVDARIDNYKGTLETLRRNLIDHANIQCTVITHRVLDAVDEVRDLQVLSEVKYAPEAHHDMDKVCLPGTRIEIIDAITRWALGADTPSLDSSSSISLDSNEWSRVLWLCGTAGAGKSSILRSCVKRLSELDRKGSYYGFNKNKPLATNLTSLFSTLARDLADLDNSRKQRLVDAVKNDTAIRTTLDCKLQFQHFIIASFKDDQALGVTVVFIDAFDESGDVMARADALTILTNRASELPPGLRVIVTSKYEPDIQDALRSPLPSGVDVTLVDNIPTHQTLRDIASYMYHELSDVDRLREGESQLNALIRRAGTSFQWAATACRFICSMDTGADPQERIGSVLGADEGLYPLYGTVMKEHCNPSDGRALERVKSILGRIICVQEPLSFYALVQLVPPDSIAMSDRIQRQIVKGLASLLSGTHSDHEPITPLHSSYRDFLCNAEHNKDFYIDKDKANQQMALACFRVMDKILTFNICQIPTSFVRNAAIPDIKGLREEHIPYHLYYACRFWGLHVSATPSGEFAQKSLESFFRKDFLHWLEVMSLMESSPQIALALLSTSHIAGVLVEERRDAMQFISMFSGAIMSSMPHIYLSSLTFVPVSSLMFQRWQGQFPGVAKLAQGQLLHWPKIMLMLEGHHDIVQCLSFSPDGNCIASGSGDRTIQLWNTETGASIGQPMEGHDHDITSIVFSPDSKKIASGSYDRTIRLWNAETGLSFGQPMQGHGSYIMSIAFSPDGKHLASGSLDHTIQLWGVETCRSIKQLKGHHPIEAIAFSPDGKQIISASQEKTIQLWNVETGASSVQLMKGHNSHIRAIAFSLDGKQIASNSGDNNLQLWSVETGASTGQPMKGHDDPIRSIAFSHNGKQIASGSWDGTIQLWNAETGVSIGQPMEGHGAIVSIAFSPDGKQIASSFPNGTIQLWSLETGVNIAQHMKGHDDQILSIAFSPNGRQIASASLDKTIQHWDVETSTNIGLPVKWHNDVSPTVAFSPDSKQMASSSRDHKTIRLWNAETGGRIGPPMKGYHGSIQAITFSPDGKQIASGSWDHTVQLWNVEMGVSIGQPMKGHADIITSIAFSPDGKQIASGSRDQTIRLWSVEAGANIGQPMKGHDDLITSVAFSPDGKWIASASMDKTIQLWNVETCSNIGQPMKGHHKITSIAFSPSPDSKQIASGSGDNVIQLWNAETGVRIGQPMKGHHDEIMSIAFSPDGKQIASGSRDTTIRLWNVVPTKKSQLKLQYPVHLFPPPPSPFQLDDGWILGPSDELVLWVPAAYHASLEHPNCRIMGTPNNTQIDFQQLKCGENWAQCKAPVE